MNHPLLPTLLSTLAILGSSRLAAADWPGFRGPTGDGMAAGKDFPLKWGPKENLLWKVKLPGHGASSPVILKDRVFLTAFTGKTAKEIVRHVLCFDRTTGKELWKKSFPAPLPENDYSSYLLQHGFTSSTPITDGERLYVFLGRDAVRAFDPADGKVLWEQSVGRYINAFGSGSSPFLFGDQLIVNATVELGALVALPKATGQPRLWKTSLNGDCWSTPRIAVLPDGTKELILNGAGALYGFDPATGKELWQVETIGGHTSSTPVIRGDLIYVMNSSLTGKHVLAVKAGGRGEVTKTHVLWKNDKVGATHCSPLVLNGKLYFFSNLATVLDAQSGKVLQQKRLEGIKNLYSSPIAAGDRILLFTRNEGAYVLRADDLEILAHNQLGDDSSINASPALVDGRLYIRSNEYLYCIGEK